MERLQIYIKASLYHLCRGSSQYSVYICYAEYIDVNAANILIYTYSNMYSITSQFLHSIVEPRKPEPLVILRSSSLPKNLLVQIYGAVTMNNTLCLAVFLALVYVRQLAWDFSAEVLIIFIICVVMGLFTSFRTTFPLWTCFFAYLLYPLSLALVYVLDFVFGWS
ncbi:unnamed protein product [Musa acuminata subsp. malaccensis]|uniref:(wild Malaysian banana) hypothetical protein n=1 Tax=Musa acuminata subsp. malaccensis TaxID=214687 RepID=A0A804L680_MUSAM|nr:unnamed protein product [Musa acuminata subsp. malaccensis]